MIIITQSSYNEKLSDASELMPTFIHHVYNFRLCVIGRRGYETLQKVSGWSTSNAKHLVITKYGTT